jgi:ATP-binding cassette, subfamily G (WHITE), member 2, PDR
MSLVGSFAFNNYDRTMESSGPGSPTRQRRYSQPQDARPQSNRRASPASQQRASLERTTSRKSTDQRPPLDHQAENTEPSSEDEVEEIKRLARQMTRATSTYSQVGANPWEYEAGSALDPTSDNFRPRAFIKAMMNLQAQEEGSSLGRTAGFAFRNLSAHGYGAGTDYQKSVGNVWLQGLGLARSLTGAGQRRIDILRNFDGLVRAGEMLVVLGPPGSGCSTFLKTITGETHGYVVDEGSHINYQGISYEQMHKHFRGEAIYTAEQDVHFPMLTVGDTLYFAARARTPRNVPGHISKDQYAKHMRDVVMATLGIRHTINTKVGNDFVRGVSGGERKRVSIAEACLNNSPLQAWDNSTRGLDSANAIEFCKTLRTSTDLLNITAGVAIYQAPGAAYEMFDKVIVLYEGRQIFFGTVTHAKVYFLNLGFVCPERQTTADFLTSMTSAAERMVRSGFENKVPRTPDEFAKCWKESAEHAELMKEIDQYEKEHPIGGQDLQRFQESMALQKAKRQRPSSPFTLSYGQQVQLCLWRGFRRLAADPTLTATQLFGNFFMALVIGSVFYDLDSTTNSFFSRGALIFFAILMNAFGSALEILTLYAQRPIVEKHTRYALYHASAEAFASMLTDMPFKICNAIIFNLTLYFLTNLRREPEAFFFFLLISFVLTLVMSMLFRTIASVSRSLSQALAPAAILILAIVIYTGFAIPTRYMLGWSRWINYIDPIAYGFEALMVNEFSGRQYNCAQFVPNGPGYGSGLDHRICTAVGSVAGQRSVDGDAFIGSSYQYYASHRWRNLGILFAFMAILMCFYLAAAEYVSAKKSKGEVLVFRRGHAPAALTKNTPNDAEAGDGNAVAAEKQTSHQNVSDVIQKQTAIFQWHDVCYDIKIKNEERRILDQVDGWVKPGTLTGLMGVSGAGKTTLLDVLATRVTMGIISGEMLVDGEQRDSSFQRKTGYVQQQDLHLETTTVREALEFSAILRQPAHVPRSEKVAYAAEIIKLLEMEEYADAVVGVPGEGLNVEQRKRLTIGVELAAKPQLLLFLDEPTSGLDSQTSWSILDLLEKLKNNGQAILCTIHQPSAVLFQRFDRLLFLQSGGQTVYFGPIGKSSKILTSYFERNGAHPCPPDANPAEWMLEVIGAAPGSYTEIDWYDTWRNSPELKEVHAELDRMKNERPGMIQRVATKDNQAQYREFAAHFTVQIMEVQKRVFQQYWRTPSYIYSKLLLVTMSGLFVGFSFFKADNSIQGLQNQMFGIFMLMTIFGQMVQQIMPLFVTQRALYEVRERPSKAYSWKAFMLSNLVVEIPWSAFCAVLLFLTWYYPIGLYANAAVTDTVHERGALMFLLILTFLIFTCTFAHMAIAGIPDAETGGNIANLGFMMTLVFCGVLATPEALPGFWIWMYWISPFHYLIEGFLGTAVKNTLVTCASNEYLNFSPPAGSTCGEYLQPYQSLMGGYLRQGTESSTTECSFCPIADTNVYLQGAGVNPNNGWRDFGIMWIYIVFNIAAAVFIYWLARVPKGAKNSSQEKTEKSNPTPAAASGERDQESSSSDPEEEQGHEKTHEETGARQGAVTPSHLESNDEKKGGFVTPLEEPVQAYTTSKEVV